MTRRRGQGEGTIRHRADGRWEGRIDLGWEGGKHQSRSLYGRTRQDVVLKLRQLQRQLDEGQPALDQRSTVSQHLELWLQSAEPRLRPTTLRFYRGFVRHQLVPALGQLRLAQLQPSDVVEAMASWQAEGLSPRSVGHARAVLRAALGDAVRWGLVPKNAAQLANPPRVPHPDPRLIPPAEVEMVVAAMSGSPQLQRLAIVSLHTGLRRGELLGLTWAAIDPEKRELHVTRGLLRVNGAYQLPEPKSRTSHRTLPLTPQALLALEEERQAQADARRAAGSRWREPLPGLCFTTVTGSPRHPDTVSHQFKSAIIRAGLPDMHLHILRKGFGGLMLASGVDLATVSALLGHSSVALTASTYAGVMPTLKRDAADRLGKLLGPAPEAPV